MATLCQSFLLQSHHSHCGSHLRIHFRTAWSKSWVFGAGGQVSYCLFGKQFSPQITGVCRLQTDENQCPRVRCLAPQAASSLGGPGLVGRQQSTSTEPVWAGRALVVSTEGFPVTRRLALVTTELAPPTLPNQSRHPPPSCFSSSI